MKLFYRKMGQGSPLIILHGLYGSSDNWLTIARALSGQYTVLVPDMRNHGRSPHSPAHNYQVMCTDVLELMDDNNLEQCILLGHSMGGKTALHLAAATPQRVSKLIIDDIAPVNYSTLPGYAALGTEHLTIINTLLQTDLMQYTRREDIETVWAEAIPDINVRRFLLKNLQREDDGHYSWRINVPVIAQNLSQILNGMDDIKRIENIPALFLKGEYSPYIRPETYPYIRQVVPEAQIETIPQAGHWLHVAQPQLFLDAVTRFLSGH